MMGRHKACCLSLHGYRRWLDECLPEACGKIQVLWSVL